MAAILDHESFHQPPDPGVWVWRYMDLSKFAALLQKRALSFVRTDHLGDPFEGSVPASTARFWDAVRSLNASGADSPYAGMPDPLLSELDVHMQKARRRMVTSSYVSCWHVNEAESAAMWRLYSKSSDAVCIRSDYSTLAAALPSECYLGLVQYLDFKTGHINPDNLLNALAFKRRSFEHEREVRAVIWDGTRMQDEDLPLIRDVPIDLGQLLKGIYVSPEAPEWFRDVVAGLATKYGVEVPVEHSEMNATPMY